MVWLAGAPFQPSLPDYCEPANDFLLRFSSTFHVCVPTELAFVSTALGICSIAAWLFAQLPQIWKNYSLQSTSGLSIYFLVEWCLGDLGNLLGASFTHQAPWQVTIGAYYVFVDVCLVLQWLWYEKLHHGRRLLRVRTLDGEDGDRGDFERVVIEGQDTRQDVEEQSTRRSAPRPIFRTPTFDRRQDGETEKASPGPSNTPGGTKVYRVGPASSFASPSPRTVLMIACLIAVAQANPLTRTLAQSMQDSHVNDNDDTSLETAGTVLSWLSTVLYLGSRLPQIYKNWHRKSTAGLSPHLFIAAFCGNLFYSAAVATNPRAWSDFGPYGSGGWVGEEGSDQAQWVAAAMPFFLGAAGVLGLDATVGLQFLIYGEGRERVVVIEEERGLKSRWRKVSGWMRGWVPSVSEGKQQQQKQHEQRPLLERDDSHGDGYGALSA